MRFLIVDSREKPKAITSILTTFEEAGVDYIISKLPFGDYTDWNKNDVVVDRKQNIAELAKNVTSDHERFKNEILLAQKAGARLVILVEQNRYKDRDKWVRVNDISDLMLWQNPYSTIRGERIYRILASMVAKYDIEVCFCDKRQTGKRILEIIYNETNG